MTRDPLPHNYCAVLSYDGTAYHGWQRLRDHPTVQAAVELALERCVGLPVPVRGAGRTDRGAHAEGQVAGFALAEKLPTDELLQGINRALPADIRALAVHAMPTGFHVRSSAVEKTYEYRIVNSDTDSAARTAHPPTRAWHLELPLDLGRIRAAAQLLIGRHDFASFATKPRFKQRSTVRELRQADVQRRDGLIVMTFRADSFLNHMVRNMVSALTRVGDGRYEPKRIATIIEARQRSASPGSAPACGLYMMKVRYDPPLRSAPEMEPPMGAGGR